KFSGAVSLLVILVAVLFNRRNGIQDFNKAIPDILDSLRKAEKLVEVNQNIKIAVGFGGCMDVFVNAVELLNVVDIKTPKTPKHQSILTKKEDLSEGFAYFFRHGAAAERYMSNDTLFQELVSAAEKIPNFRSAMGGNAPVMANRFAAEGADVLLAAQASQDFKKHLNSTIQIAGNETDRNDIHLIMEYKTGEKWGQYESTRANRFIVHSDKFNPTLGSLEPLMNAYVKFNPDLLVVGGLQMMDNFPFREGERNKRLNILQQLLVDATQRKTLTHFELASFVDESLVTDLMDKVLPYSDSMGMNEQELPNLLSFVKYSNITMISDCYPRVATVLDQLRSSYKILRSKYNRISRIHVHTIAFQAILTKKSSQWKNTMSATAHASLTANRHVCGTPVVDVLKSKLLFDDSFSTTVDTMKANKVPLIPDKPVSCWEEDYGDGEVVQICIAPNLVCTQVHQTAGGGDNISSAGLSFQI
uniref:ADP-dependent glucokinase n=1 Tax=Ciona savignyi TaxID=51511 RepID=H2YAA4_CIOSA